MTTGPVSDAFEFDYCAERLKALGDPVRLRVVDLLRHGEMSVGDISKFLEIPLSGASHHLQILKHAQLVTSRRDGRFIYYQLHHDLLRSKSKKSGLLNLGCCTLAMSGSQ